MLQYLIACEFVPRPVVARVVCTRSYSSQRATPERSIVAACSAFFAFGLVPCRTCAGAAAKCIYYLTRAGALL